MWKPLGQNEVREKGKKKHEDSQCMYVLCMEQHQLAEPFGFMFLFALFPFVNIQLRAGQQPLVIN